MSTARRLNFAVGSNSGYRLTKAPVGGEFSIPIRVYFEDTDAGGIVYYANYLKFIERARTEWVRDLGVDQGALKAEAGIVFAVRRVEADFVSPARFDDVVTVTTTLDKLTGARLVLDQSVHRGDDRIFSASVTLVALSEDGRPARLPANIRQKLAGEQP